MSISIRGLYVRAYYREIMHAMWKPQKFKTIYLLATLYVLTLTLPSASAVYWAFGDQLLNHSNAFALLPRTGFRDTAVILMLIHQVIVEFNRKYCFVTILQVSADNYDWLFICAVHYIWICMHSTILCMGKIHWNA